LANLDRILKIKTAHIGKVAKTNFTSDSHMWFDHNFIRDVTRVC